MSLPVVGADYVTCELVAATSAGATTLLVSTPTEAFPTLGASEYFYLTIVDEASYAIDANPPVQREIVKVTAYSTVSTGYSLTVVRASGGTTAQIWASGAICEIRPCAQWFQDLKSTDGTSLAVTDGITTVTDVANLFVAGGVVSDLGAGAAGVTTAPPDASYLTLGTNSTLTNERVLTAGTNVTFTDGGAGSTLTINASGGGSAAAWYFGNGEDSSATLDGTNTYSWASKSSSTYTMTRSVVLTDLTVDNGVTLKTDGYVIYCSGTLTNNGTISNSGTIGGNGLTPGAPGNCYGGGTNGTGNNSAPQATTSLGGNAGAGGTSSESSSYGTNIVVLPTEANGGKACIGSIVCAYTGRAFDGTLIQGGAGGFGGRSNSGSPTGNGYGGGGGGVVGIMAAACAGSGTVAADGGPGSNGGATGCGGGAGGGGGVIFIISKTTSVSGLWTLSVVGGAGGAGNGSSSYDGTMGASGRSIVWEV